MIKKVSNQEIISEEIRQLVSDIDRFIVKKDSVKSELSDMWKQTFLGLSLSN